MLEITRLTVEHLAQGCVTDCPAPRIGFAVQSDRNDAELTDAILQVGDWNVHLPQDGQPGTAYNGPALLPDRNRKDHCPCAALCNRYGHL